ncbi:MAG: TVP38/TMEM64 family protein [Planctomycetota bacterium]|nr:MAG: TVP38/TMEM64 family protein [Planctomycetota bacterium]
MNPLNPSEKSPSGGLSEPEEGSPKARQTWGKPVALVVVAVIATIAYWQLGDRLSLDYLAQRESQLRSLQQSAPGLAAVVAIGIYVVVTGLSFPGAAMLTLVFGWYFGFVQGLFIVSVGSTTGATVAFLLSRYFLRDWVQRSMQARLTGINDALEREGAFYLFTLRLIPVVPFFVVNAVMGLTRIRATTFWWVSQIGMLPGTAAYVYAGSTVPSLEVLAKEGAGKVLSWQLVLGFIILGLFPLAVKKLVSLFASQPTTEEVTST